MAKVGAAPNDWKNQLWLLSENFLDFQMKDYKNYLPKLSIFSDKSLFTFSLFFTYSVNKCLGSA